jgi:arylsulfatase A-like enzyme
MRRRSRLAIAAGAVLALGCAPGAPGEDPGAPPAPPPRHLVLVVVDTLRGDSLDAAQAPTWDALVAAGSRPGRAWSAGTWTLPGVASLFSGMSVRQHGWDLPTGQMGRYPALPAVPLLAEVLRDAGFRTTGLYANPYLSEKLGFERGFDRWRRVPDRAMLRELGRELAAGWGGGERQFLYLHLLGPHSPLKPSEAARRRWEVDASWIDPKIGFELGAAQRNHPPGAAEAYPPAYHAAVEDADALVGALLAALAPWRRETLVVLTSDHGEMLGDHGFFGHGNWVWESLTHVPLVVDGPGEDPPLPAAMSTADLPALVCARLGVAHQWPEAFPEGTPLLAQRQGRVALLSEGRYKGIWEPGAVDPVVYDLEADPGELHPLPDDHGLPAAWARLQALVPAGGLSGDHVELDAETIAALEALGYLPADGPGEEGSAGR